MGTSASVVPYLLLLTCSVASESRPKRIVTSLIHRDSVHSPYYNPRDTASDRAKQLLKASSARLAYFQSRTSLDVTRDLSFDLIPSFPALLVNFSIGSPPVPQLTVMDTGSNLLWVECHPSGSHLGSPSPVFDPSKSSTYSRVTCNTAYCRYAQSSCCGSSYQCLYNQTYIAGPSSRGELAKEQVMFRTSDDGLVTVSNVVFGCGHENDRFRQEKYSGVFGLGGQPISVVSRLGSVFSYCIGNLLDPHYNHNKLIIGEGAIVEGNSTPVRIITGVYYINLVGISVGDKMLDINFGIFGGPIRRTGNAVIDSGTGVTWLVPEAYKELSNEVKGLLEGVLENVNNKLLELCYRGFIKRDLVGFPVVTFHFIGGAELVLDVGSLFYQAGDVFCMAIAPTDMKGLSIIGLMAQQYHNVAYDVLESRMYFQKIECELLDD